MTDNFATIVQCLFNEQVVAYPTEAVFGLGCNPNSERAVKRLLALKQRSVEKGLILIAPQLDLLLPYIDEKKLHAEHWQMLEQVSEQAITWVVPARESVSTLLKGQFDSIAIRLCRVPAVVELCQATGFALTSTSANLSGQEPCRTAYDVALQFGADFPVLNASTLGRTNPSEIRDIFSQHILRQG